ncbi:hypothetical protein LJC16_01720 [Bacteroidales bacterium OttesenSCG-928-C19]|nr:hypothetical protein [Bacteroidales bacterium OttesenSCG-928-C19]
MKKNIDTILLVCLLILQSFYVSANNKQENIRNKDSVLYVLTENYEGVIWGINYPQNHTDYKILRWNPTTKDIEKAEKILRKFMNKEGEKWLENQDSNCPIIHENLDKYIRQYQGSINDEGEKILEISCFWKELESEFPNWKTHLAIVTDGCSYFWTIKINLSKRKCFGLMSANSKQKNNIQNKDTALYILTKNYEGVLWGINYPLNLIDFKSLRWDPTIEDVEQAEKLLRKYITKKGKGILVSQGGTCPIIHENLDKYIRQYMGVIDYFTGEKVIEINCFWKDDEKDYPYWKTHRVNVMDGCSYYWRIKINLSKMECFDYSINGN